MVNLSLLIITSKIPSHPNNLLITKCINSIKNISFLDKFIIYDKPKEQQPNDNYEKYIEKNKSDFPEFEHHQLNEHGHFIGALNVGLSLLKTKYFLLVQHDAMLVGEFPIDKIMNAKFDWNIIALHHKKIGLNEPTHWYPIIKKIDDYFIKTYGWSERFFIGKTDFFINNPLIKTKNFTDIIFYKNFTKLYKKHENIKTYKNLDYNKSKNKKIYDQYWDKWKVFTINNGCFSQHLYGRTLELIKE